MDFRPRTLVFAKLFDQLGHQLRIVLRNQVVDRLLFDFQFEQMTFQALPVLLAFLAFGEIQFGDDFLGALKRDVFAVVVIVANNVLLVL